METIETYQLKYAKLSDVVSHIGASCLSLSWSSAFLVATCFSEPLGGVGGEPLGLVLASPRYPWVRAS